MDKLTENFLSLAKVRKLISRGPIMMDSSNEEHTLIFRRILELSISQGRWFGATSRKS